MISKNSFFSLVKENCKHRMVIIVISALYVIFGALVTGFGVQNIIAMETLYGQVEGICQLFLPQRDLLPILMSVSLGLVLAMDGFSYLHSKQKTDLYEALPVSRKIHFLVIVLNSFLVYLGILVLVILIQAAIAAGAGALCTEAIYNLQATFVCSLLIFLMCFSTGTLAMIMTGHSIVAIMGFCVLGGYSVALRYLWPTYASLYLSSFVDSTVSTFNLRSSAFLCCSPFGQIFRLLAYDDELKGLSSLEEEISYVWTFHAHAGIILASLLLAVVIGILAYFLYMRRSAEAAGNAMAFPKFNPVIRVAMSVLLSLYAGWFLAITTVYNMTAWAIAGIILGCVFFNGFTEAVFQFDVKAAFTHKRGWLITGAVCGIFLAAFVYDLTGYNTWVPNEDQIKMVTFTVGDEYGYVGGDNSFDGGFVDLDFIKKIDGLTGENKEKALKLAADISKNADHSIPGNDYSDDEYTESGTYRYVYFYYVMKNGSIRQREYLIDMKALEKKIDPLYATEDYKNDYSPIYTTDLKQMNSLQYYNGSHTLNKKFSSEERESLIEALKKDISALTMTEINEDVAMGDMYLYKKEDVDYELWQYFNIYPTYSNTLKVLKKMGVDVDATKFIENEDVKSIVLNEEENPEDEESHIADSVRITDPALIKKCESKLVNSAFISAYSYTINPYYMSDYYVTIEYNEKEKSTDENSSYDENDDYEEEDDGDNTYCITNEDAVEIIKEAKMLNHKSSY